MSKVGRISLLDFKPHTATVIKTVGIGREIDPKMNEAE